MSSLFIPHFRHDILKIYPASDLFIIHHKHKTRHSGSSYDLKCALSVSSIASIILLLYLRCHCSTLAVCRSFRDSSAQRTPHTRFPQCLMAPIAFAFDQGITDLIKYLLFALCSFRYCCCPQNSLVEPSISFAHIH